MLITNFDYNDFYNLITSILDSSFNISITKIHDPSDFNNYVDIEFRKIVWPDYNHEYKANMDELLQMKKGALCILQSAMDFITIVFSFPREISTDIIVIGPFLEVEPDDTFIINLLNNKIYRGIWNG